MRAARHVLRSLNRSAEDVRKLTTQDPLTGLPNQRVMLERLCEELARRRSGVVVVALVDLDGFREVNDTLGRSGGDALLTSIAEHLKTGLPPGAVLGRFEEDEFAVVIEGDDPGVEDSLIESLRASLMRPIFMDRMWQITASIGIARAPDHGASGEEIVRRAGLALRAAKRAGRGNTGRFEQQIETDYAERRFLLHELQSAIALQAFDIEYQPIVAADGAAMVGVEALLRWTHPTRGPITPSVFIPLAEQSGLMSQLGEIVLRRALSDGARWPTLSVAVNLSPLQIRDRWLVDLVANVMAETGIDASRVVLEVTEGVLIDNPQEAQTRLEALRALGVRLALDDFGTGYSSLNHLQKFPFDRLKIDRSFVASLGSSGNTGAIIQSIVTLGHTLGMKVLAEGVEKDEQRVLLRLAGCDEMQGFLFAKPEHYFGRFLAARDSRISFSIIYWVVGFWRADHGRHNVELGGRASRMAQAVLDRLGYKSRRRMCPLYVAGLIGPGDRKSVQPMAERLAPGDYDQLHHFVAAGVGDAAPLEQSCSFKRIGSLVAATPCW